MRYFIELPEVWVTEFLERDPACAGYWISSLTQSWQKGYADNCSLSWNNYVDVVRRLRLHTNKPIMVDVDMLFNEPSIAATIARELHAVGCTTILVESKRFPKVNSLKPAHLALSTPDEFCRLLNKVKTTVPELEVIARIEYLATTRDPELTQAIARRTIRAGADGVVIHWGVDSDTSLLKQTLAALRQEQIKSGIIPTRYLNQVVGGEFDGLADFSILGNICSSFIRHAFSGQTVESLLATPCMFEPILDRVDSHEPRGHRTLIVLGAKPDASGRFLLEDPAVIERFARLLGTYYHLTLVTDVAAAPPLPQSKAISLARLEGSLGEVDSLAAATEFLNTEYTTVVYADLEPEAFAWLENPGLTFAGDTFAGILNVKTDLLLDMLHATPPSASLLDMASRHQVPITTEKAR